jgi:hypothetical protein
MKKYLVFFIAFILVSSSCTKKTTTIIPINQAQNLSPSGMIYALPKTNLSINVESKFTSVIPGPYAQFAQKYLGIINVPTTAKSFWIITKVEVLHDIQPDLQALFVVEPSSNYSVDFLSITNKGLIIPVGLASFKGHEHSVKDDKLLSDLGRFHDLSSTPFISTERTTHYSRTFQDSSFVRVPVHKTIVVEKSLEDKAREAADFIFSLRKRRFELLSGDADFVADGKAAEAVLKEISRLEEEYLTLFVGKEYVRFENDWFNFSPASKEEGSSILFRFSSARGVLPSSDLSGSPILINITPKASWQDIEVLNQLTLEKGVQRSDAVYYRLPIPSNVRINDSNTEFYSQELTIYQFGPLVRIPARFIINKENQINFPKVK